jgi:hypothetical protein
MLAFHRIKQDAPTSNNKTGTLPLPAGVFIQVWPFSPKSLDWASCNNTGGVSVELPKIGPGKSKA